MNCDLNEARIAVTIRLTTIVQSYLQFLLIFYYFLDSSLKLYCAALYRIEIAQLMYF